MMKQGSFGGALVVSTALLFLGLAACDNTSQSPPPAAAPPNACIASPQNQGSGSAGTASVFHIDPIVSSGNAALSPKSTTLDQYRDSVTLANLSGKGVLQGSNVDVRNSLTCNGDYLAFDPKNNFSYSHSNPRFQEVMSYYYGDLFRSMVTSATGSFIPNRSQIVRAHCEYQDNSYYDPDKQEVCLGDSAATPGAYYSDDASVVTHEIQHATTGDTYSLNDKLRSFFYDEGGSLNEAISDFMALVFLESENESPFDPRVFSRWALETFSPGENNVRGVNLCPRYDSSYPDCASYAVDASGFSADQSHVSFSYPDGMGWPYSSNLGGPGYLQQVYNYFPAQSEIHNASTVLSGALWDIYEALKTDLGSAQAAQGAVMKLAMEALRHLPKPSATNLAPVTYTGYASALVSSAALLGMSASSQTAITAALTHRGLYGFTALEAGWAAVGPGTVETPGLKVVDSPTELASWLLSQYSDPSIITQTPSTGGGNRRLDPGEVVALFFDIQNNSNVTAGGVLVDALSNDPDLQFLNGNYNVGPINSPQNSLTQPEAQIRYLKVNGKAIVTALTSSNATMNVPTGNTYFKTDPYFTTYELALWAKVSPTAAHGKVVTIQVTVTPTNGPAVVLNYPVTIQ